MAVDGGGCNLRQRAPAHGYGRRKMQPLVTSFGVAAGDELRRGAARGDSGGRGHRRRAWRGAWRQRMLPPVTSLVWGVVAKDAATGDELRHGAWMTKDTAAGDDL
ncbi:hypothetical protein OsI_03351 [Oryza sativa Indica Group]|uniref:Uncharacterized protein n=1 Tax=Oryza sativa subsp. indica TaxID=39946 RepID=B8A803_ORYSI|nr:hypothetical protein OsI_03351 [Oryza sativa Indica Group]